MRNGRITPISLVILGVLVVQPLIARSNSDQSRYMVTIGGKVGFIDRTGTTVIQPQFARAHEFSEGRAAVMIGGDAYGRGGTWGYIDTTGTFILPPKLPEFRGRNADVFGNTEPVTDFSEDRAAVLVNGKWGFIDHEGTMVIAPQFTDDDTGAPGPFREGLARVKINGKWGYINTAGHVAIPPKFTYAYQFSEGMAQVSIGDPPRTGYINRQGRFVIPPQFDTGRAFSEGVAFVRWDDYRQGSYVDRMGRRIVASFDVDAPTPSTVRPPVDFSAGLAPSRHDGKWGYIDKHGAFVIKPAFDAAGQFTEGAALVMQNGLFGYIDTSGKWILEPQFSYAAPFRNGLASVRHDRIRRDAYIDPQGHYVWVAKK